MMQDPQQTTGAPPPPPPGFVPGAAPTSTNIPPPPAGFTPVGQSVSKNDEGIAGSSTIPENQKGVIANLKDIGKGYLNLPGNVWDAFTKDPEDDQEKMVADTMSQLHNIPPQLALALHRMVV